MSLARLVLHAQSPDQLAGFYVKHLGMTMTRDGASVILGFGGQDASIELVQAREGPAYAHARTDRYWKIGITLPNVDIACDQLRRAGLTVSEPRQFEDIGYMCHLADPEGFSIELLQHKFAANREREAGDRSQKLGGGARIGQITLRTTDIESALAFYRDRLGMRLLSIQPLKAYGFTLYFLAFTEEQPPQSDLEAVENREWLWMRPYTTLELQYLLNEDLPPKLPNRNTPGFAGLLISSAEKNVETLYDEAGGRVALNGSTGSSTGSSTRTG